MRSTLLSFFTAPSAAPVSLQGHSKSSTSIFVTWGQVPPSKQNGVILNYTVSYKEASHGSARTVTVDEPTNSITLKGLNEYTNYSITVFASTIKGAGIVSAPIFVITDEGSKIGSVLFVYLLSSLEMFRHALEENRFQFVGNFHFSYPWIFSEKNDSNLHFSETFAHDDSVWQGFRRDN